MDRGLVWALSDLELWLLPVVLLFLLQGVLSTSYLRVVGSARIPGSAGVEITCSTLPHHLMVPSHTFTKLLQTQAR